MREYKKNNHEEYESDELTMKKGRWSLWQENDGTSTLWHQCTKDREEVYGETKKSIVVYPIKYRTWSFKTKHEIKPRWCCGMCDKKPPESILVPWMMHNWDHLTELMERSGMLWPTTPKDASVAHARHRACNASCRSKARRRMSDSRPAGALI